MIGARTYRGQPLVALVLILGGWIAMRAMVFDAVAFAPDVVAVSSVAPSPARPVVPVSASPPGAPTPTMAPVPIAGPALAAGVPGWSMVPVPAAPRRLLQLAPPVEAVPPMVVPVSTSAGHQIMFLSAMASLPLPPVIFIPPASGTDLPDRPAAPQSRPAERRWSADGWLLLRGGRTGLTGGAPLASYGASQAGAVIRYRLAPASPHRPDAYLRASSAISSRDREVAAGIAARPLARLPIVVAAEARLTDQPGGLRLRPAAFAYTELPPAHLPLGLRGEAYGQAGYVGGTFATPFADAQARIDHGVAHVGAVLLRAGAGAWGGAQKRASRVDIGPVASIGIATGGGGARLDVDWRFRIAGNAAPASGPALTLSAGF